MPDTPRTPHGLDTPHRQDHALASEPQRPGVANLPQMLARAVVSLSQHSLASVGLAVTAALLLGLSQPSLRAVVEAHTLGWLQGRQEARTEMHAADSGAEQPAALAEPLLVTEPAKPGAQIVQAATDKLPSNKPVVDMPAGHTVQLEALAAAHEPAAHAAQEGATPLAHAHTPLALLRRRVAPVPAEPAAHLKR